MKPHLVWSGTRWWCYTWHPKHAVGSGMTPAIAYADWVTDVVFKAEMGL